MRFIVQVRANAASEAGVLPTAEMLAPMGRFNDELIKAGIMLAADGLKDSSKGARLEFSNGKVTVIDGPFAETKELIAGFWIVQAKSKAEVIERFKHAPMQSGDVLEIREIFEADDFGDDLAPAMREQEARLRRQLS
ncbi:MAG TPA: YciI family protein [Candidatus Baltobacteraceae bacterium]|nr:YciI family protein [Candidatus Baltobacteraceae bacterium]